MQGIAQKILAAPERYSVDMLRRAVETGLLPAYVGIPLIQAKMQMQQQVQQSASLGQPSPDQQPTVAEQVMAQGGVDALPTNLPQEYAAGGIVAFSGGGEPTVGDPMGSGFEAFTTPRPPVSQTALGRLWNAYRGVPEWRQRLELEEAERARQAQERPRQAPPVVATPAAATATPAPAPAPRAQGPSGAPRAVTPPPAPGITGLPAVEKLPELVRPAGPTAVESARELFGKAREEAEGISRDTEARIRETRGLMQGEAFEGYKKQLEDEARRSGADRADAKNMALFKAGLAMMAGTSRHALENIGKGAMVGVEDFQTAARELRKADKDRQKEMALIEQARRAEKAGNIKEEVQLLQRAEDRRLKGLESLTTAISAATGVDRADATQIALQNFAQGSQNYRLGQQLRAEQQMAAERNRTTLAAANIGARAAEARARDPNAIPSGVQTAMYQQRIALQEPARAFALKQLGLKTEPPIPGPNAGPLDPAVLNYTRYRDLVNRYIESNIPAPQGRAAPQAPTTSGATGNWDNWGATEVTPRQR